MSKSSGGFLTLQSLIDKGYDPLDYRYFLLGGHYRSQMQFSWESLDGAKNARRSLTDKTKEKGKGKKEKREENGGAEKYLEAFNKALEDDLNTPRALAEMWGLLRDGSVEPEAALAAVFDMDEVLGLGLRDSLVAAESPEDGDFVREIENVIAERAEAKKARDFARADSLRQGLKERGIVLEDGPGGTIWRRI
jgi:cysteinyl-tRNA synthetase